MEARRSSVWEGPEGDDSFDEKTNYARQEFAGHKLRTAMMVRHNCPVTLSNSCIKEGCCFYMLEARMLATYRVKCKKYGPGDHSIDLDFRIIFSDEQTCCGQFTIDFFKIRHWGLSELGLPGRDSGDLPLPPPPILSSDDLSWRSGGSWRLSGPLS